MDSLFDYIYLPHCCDSMEVFVHFRIVSDGIQMMYVAKKRPFSVLTSDFKEAILYREICIHCCSTFKTKWREILFYDLYIGQRTDQTWGGVV